LAPLAACGSTVVNTSPSPRDDDDTPIYDPTPVCTEGTCCPADPPTAGAGCELSDFASCDFGCDGVYECQPVYPEAGAPSEWVKVDDGTCCPDEPPTHGSSCGQDVTCSYDHSPWTEGCSTPFDAVCKDGTWTALAPASCEPIAGCDITGTFDILYSPWSPEPPLGGGGPKELVIATDATGHVVTSAPDAVVTDGGCLLQARWSYQSCWEEDGETLCEYEDFTAEINFNLETPAGGMTYECWGECGAMSSAAITLLVK
ncbi:MAG: hypothetical protein RIF41_34735, partial [Polyangiaceae bacterium]